MPSYVEEIMMGFKLHFLLSILDINEDCHHEFLLKMVYLTIVRLTDVRTSISGLITKLETDPHLNWHSFLDSYALISGQVSLTQTYKTFCPHN
jgi:Mediator of RNA polymerase II transcription complex subunit 8